MTTDESAKCERCDDTGCPQCDPEWAQHQVRAPKADEDAINAKLAESAKREGAELLPCPFCGSAVTLTEREGFVGLTCPPESPCTGSRLYQCFHAKDRATAIAAWNRRDNSALETSNKALREAEAKLEHLLRAAGDGVEVGRQRMIVTDAGEFRNLSASTDTLQVRTEDVPIYEWRLRVLGMTLRESLDALAPALVDGKEK